MNTRNSITSQDEKLVNMQMSIGYKSGLPVTRSYINKLPKCYPFHLG